MPLESGINEQDFRLYKIRKRRDMGIYKKSDSKTGKKKLNKDQECDKSKIRF